MKSIGFALFVFVLGLTNQTFAQRWWPVGTPGFSDGEVSETKIVIDGNGTPYVAYCEYEGEESYKAIVKKYAGSNWVSVGSEISSDTEEFGIDIAINSNGTPYVAYMDEDNI